MGTRGPCHGATAAARVAVAQESWALLGARIVGAGAKDESGATVALSSDGTTVASAARFAGSQNRGHMRVYAYSAAAGAWEQRGGTLDGEANMDYAGDAVALSANGMMAALGGHE